MSGHAFNPKHGPVFVEAEATGPAGSANLKLVLDTGATRSLINRSTLLYLGLDPDQSKQHVRMTTGSTVEVVPVVVLTRLSTLGRHCFGFPVIGHALPLSAAVDGLLGLDYLRDHALTIDFRAGRIVLA
jgi:hypothetical protein